MKLCTWVKLPLHSEHTFSLGRLIELTPWGIVLPQLLLGSPTEGIRRRRWSILIAGAVTQLTRTLLVCDQVCTLQVCDQTPVAPAGFTSLHSSSEDSNAQTWVTSLEGLFLEKASEGLGPGFMGPITGIRNGLLSTH